MLDQVGGQVVVIAQPLAWAILTALVGGGVFLGIHVGGLTHLKRLLDDLVAAIRDITAQQRKMEESLHAQTVASARMEGRLSALVDSEARLSRSVDRAIEVRAASQAEGKAS